MKVGTFSRFLKRCGLTAALAASLFEVTAFSQVYNPIAYGQPFVRIVSPPNHAVFCGPLSIPIFAYTSPILRITNVEFYANGSNDLGSGVNLSAITRPTPLPFASTITMPPTIVPRLGQLWGFVWSNAPVGTYSLTAVATGPRIILPPAPPVTPGYSYTSAPVNITVLASTNGTNPTDIVSIRATDPVAVAGTNCWWLWPGATNAVASWTNWPPPGSSTVTCTNWGPKAALFTVRRCGDDSRPLLVSYSIGGTASNGVDYVAIPSSILIPAHSTYGLIPIVPIDNGSNRLVKTVVLTLTPSITTGPEPGYILGYPTSAEAIIIYGWPRPLPWLLPDGSFHVSANGPDGAWSVVQSSPDLVNWTPVATNQVFQGSVDYADPGAAGNPSLFYRVVPLTGSP